MAVNNFLVFDPDDKNILTDAEYLADSQRVNGLESGVARSKLFNKVLKQTSTMAYAIGEVFKAKGINVTDTDVSALIDELDKIFVDNYGNRKSFLLYAPTSGSTDTIAAGSSGVYTYMLDAPIPLSLYHSYNAQVHLFGNIDPKPVWDTTFYSSNQFTNFSYLEVKPIIDGVDFNKIVSCGNLFKEDFQNATPYMASGAFGLRSESSNTSVKMISSPSYRSSSVIGLPMATYGAPEFLSYGSTDSYVNYTVNTSANVTKNDLADKLGDDSEITGFKLILNSISNHTYYLGPVAFSIEFA